MSYLCKQNMDIDGIKEIIARDENRVLELKKTTGELIKGMQSLCAFLNTDGGWLFFGITPDLKILGHLPNELTVETIKQSHRSFPQNPIIAEALFLTSLILHCRNISKHKSVRYMSESRQRFRIRIIIKEDK